MDLEFDLSAVQSVEFLVVVGNRKVPELDYLEVDDGVRTELVRIAVATWEEMWKIGDEPEMYDPANDYSPRSFVYLPVADELAWRLKHFYDYGNARQLHNPEEVIPKISTYCARIIDSRGNRILGVKQVAGVGAKLQRQRGRVRLRPNRLELVEEPEFQLDPFFDALIDAANVFVFRHVGVEGVGRFQAAIESASPANLNHLAANLAFVDFRGLQEPLAKGKKAARLLASIKANNYGANFDQGNLIQYCVDHEIGHTTVDGRIVIDPADGVRFLRILARYYTDFRPNPNSREGYLSSNRRRVI